MASSTIPSPYSLLNATLYNPTTATDVHTETTVTLNQNWNNFKTLIFYFLATSSTNSTRSMLTISSQTVSQAGWHALAQGTTNGGVKIGYPSTEYNKITILQTSLSGLYLYRIWGTN